VNRYILTPINRRTLVTSIDFRQFGLGQMSFECVGMPRTGPSGLFRLMENSLTSGVDPSSCARPKATRTDVSLRVFVIIIIIIIIIIIFLHAPYTPAVEHLSCVKSHYFGLKPSLTSLEMFTQAAIGSNTCCTLAPHWLKPGKRKDQWLWWGDLYPFLRRVEFKRDLWLFRKSAQNH